MIAFDLFPPAPARVGLLGCGTVGSALARAFGEGRVPGAVLSRVLVRDTSRDRGLPVGLVTSSIDEVLASQPDVIIEAIGGCGDALTYVSKALARGISVVTANKTLIAHHGPQLMELANRRGAALRHEAAVCAAIPILAALEHLRGDRVVAISAIVSGTCNFILSAMTRGATFEKALTEAQRLGLAEPDPSADLSGRDAAEKACLLAAAVGLSGVTPDRVVTVGITAITREDIAYARRTGYVVKLLAEIDTRGPEPLVRVGPTLVAARHPLARVHGADNAVLVMAELGGELFLQGPGAGPVPTASAILGDVAKCLQREPDREVRVAKVRGGEVGVGLRRHAVHIARGDCLPDGLLVAVRAHGLEAEDVEVSRGAARVIVAHSSAGRVAGLASALGSHASVMPVCDVPGGVS